MCRRRGILAHQPNASLPINTTPPIDVMLVMPVMFVITIPQPKHGVDVNLPGTGPGSAKIRDQNHISIDAAGAIRRNGATMIACPGIDGYRDLI